MKYCRNCGAALPDDSRFCPECGTPATGSAPRTVETPAQTDYPVKKEKKRKKRKSIFGRLWFWLLVLIIAGSIYGNRNYPKQMSALIKKAESVIPFTQKETEKSSSVPTANPTEKPSAVATAKPTEKPSLTTAAEPTQQPKASVVSESDIRPEVKEFLDSYEQFMDEYIAFMQKYSSSDPASVLTMMGDYTKMLARYAEFSAKIDAYDEEELTSAELAYYIGVTSRVEQKMLLALGD